MGGHTLTTRELALLCSYARMAVLTTGIVEIRPTKSASSESITWSSDARVGLVRVGELDEEATESAGVGCVARKENEYGT